MSLIDRFKKLPTSLMALHVTAKFVFGVGLGVLLAGYLEGFGWWLILLSIIMSIPGVYKILSGK